MRKPKLLAIGGAHVDRRGRSDGPFMPGVSNPGTMREEVGGAAFNTARVAARLGTEVSMMTARGGDAAGAAVTAAIMAAGLADLSVTHLDRVTPSYTAILDDHGELVGAIADMRLYDTAFDKLARRAATRIAVAAADAVLIDANLSETAIARITEIAAGKPVFANAISPAKAVRLIAFLPALSGLFMNGNEARAITGLDTDDEATLVTALRGLGLSSAVVTRGAGSVIGYDVRGAFLLTPPKVEAGDVTGAGDALAGATIAAQLAGKPLSEALRPGVAAACLIVASTSAVPDFSDDSFAAMLQRVGKARPLAIADRQDA